MNERARSPRMGTTVNTYARKLGRPDSRPLPNIRLQPNKFTVSCKVVSGGGCVLYPILCPRPLTGHGRIFARTSESAWVPSLAWGEMVSSSQAQGCFTPGLGRNSLGFPTTMQNVSWLAVGPEAWCLPDLTQVGRVDQASPVPGRPGAPSAQGMAALAHNSLPTLTPP